MVLALDQRPDRRYLSDVVWGLVGEATTRSDAARSVSVGFACVFCTEKLSVSILHHDDDVYGIARFEQQSVEVSSRNGMSKRHYAGFRW